MRHLISLPFEHDLLAMMHSRFKLELMHSFDLAYTSSVAYITMFYNLLSSALACRTSTVPILCSSAKSFRRLRLLTFVEYAAESLQNFVRTPDIPCLGMWGSASCHTPDLRRFPSRLCRLPAETLGSTICFVYRHRCCASTTYLMLSTKIQIF